MAQPLALCHMAATQDSELANCHLQLRSRFEALRADEILDRRHGAYRASHIVLYSLHTGRTDGRKPLAIRG